MECIVHIGDIKSGTTSVQAALAANNIPAAYKKAIYPCAELNHNHLAILFKQGESKKRQYVRNIRKLINASPDSNAFIISGEILSTVDPQVVKKELESCFGDLSSKFTIIHYVRPHFSRAVSAYAEQAKIGATSLPLNEFVKISTEKGRFKHSLKMKAWQREFQDNYIVRPMQKSTLYQENIVADFFLTALGEISYGWTPPPQVNKALSNEGLLHVRRLQVALEGRSAALRHSLGYEFERYFSAIEKRPSAPAIVGRALAELFFNGYKGDAKEADMYLSHPVLENALYQGFQDGIKENYDKEELWHTEEANEIISKLLNIAKIENERDCAVQLRRDRFKRYIDIAKMPHGHN